MSKEDADKINAVFEHLDVDKDGFIKYEDVYNLLNGPRADSEAAEQREMLWNGDNVKMSPESWYYMSDVLLPLDEYLELNPAEKTKEESLSGKGLQCSHRNPLYRARGWTLEQLTAAYIKHGFFDLDHHFGLVQRSRSESESAAIPRTERVYNLMTDLAPNTPSTALIVRHALATGQHLYVHILSAELDPHKVTWEKLEELHSKMGTMEVLQRAKETEEILPQDVLYYDPEECDGQIPATIPDYSVFWHSIFENQLQDLPDYVIQDYFDTIVRPDIEAKNGGLSVEPKGAADRDRMIEEHVYNEMEQFMQQWLWKKYAQLMTHPVYAVSTWGDHHLMMNAQ